MLLFLIDAEEGIDRAGEYFLSIIKAQVTNKKKKERTSKKKPLLTRALFSSSFSGSSCGDCWAAGIGTCCAEASRRCAKETCEGVRVALSRRAQSFESRYRLRKEEEKSQKRKRREEKLKENSFLLFSYFIFLKKKLLIFAFLILLRVLLLFICAFLNPS